MNKKIKKGLSLIYLAIGILLILGLNAVYSQEEGNISVPGTNASDQSTTSIQQTTSTTDQNLPQSTTTVIQPSQPSLNICKEYRGLEYTKCIIRARLQLRKQIAKEVKKEIQEIIDEEINKIMQTIQNENKLGREIFILNPNYRVVATGKIIKLENNILDLDVLGFVTQWDISGVNTEGNQILNVGNKVKILGVWDQQNKIFKALRIKTLSYQLNPNTSTQLQPRPFIPKAPFKTNSALEQIKNQLMQEIQKRIQEMLIKATSTNQ